MRHEAARAGEGRLDEIDRIELTTHESAIRIISKVGALNNPADRDHCLQYMVAVPLIFGRLIAEDYEDAVAADPRIDGLRGKMVVQEDKGYSREYLEADKRSIANAIQVFFRTAPTPPRWRWSTRSVIVAAARRIPLLVEKFRHNLATRFPAKRSEAILALCQDGKQLAATPVHAFMDLLVI